MQRLAACNSSQSFMQLLFHRKLRFNLISCVVQLCHLKSVEECCPSLERILKLLWKLAEIFDSFDRTFHVLSGSFLILISIIWLSCSNFKLILFQNVTSIERDQMWSTNYSIFAQTYLQIAFWNPESFQYKKRLFSILQDSPGSRT